MNGESFYDSSTQKWQPISPKTTPQTTKFAFYPYEPSHAPAQSPEQAFGWTNSHTPMRTPANQSQGGSAGNVHSATRTQTFVSPYAITSADTSFYQPYSAQSGQGEFPSGSFVDHFNSTTLDDPFTDGRTMSSSFSASQMQTPPPTRDDSGRRKPHQPRMVEFQTPSTIASRRMSVPNETWNPPPTESVYPAPSPFTFTPLQFSPPGQFGFTPSGPMTAPVYPQSNVFWEPNSNHTLNALSFSTIAEEPYSQSFGVNVGDTSPQYFLDGSNLPGHRLASSEAFRGPLPSNAPSVTRPQSARPALSNAGYPVNKPIFTTSSTGVDPNMLWNTQGFESSSIATEDQSSSSVAGVEEKQNYQPYQHQLESLKREKEEGHRRSSRGSFGSRPADMPIQSAQHGLHRSLTDSRARRGVNQRSVSSQAGFSDKQDTLLPSQTAQIHRESSPLKRHRSNSYTYQSTPTKARARRSVVLTVDEQGHARTEIKQVMDDASSTPVFHIARSVDEGSDSSELSEALSRSQAICSSSEPSPGPSDAQNALREVVRNRRLSRRPDANRPNSSQNIAETRSAQDPMIPVFSTGLPHTNAGSENSNNSPTTITDPDLGTPTSDRRPDLPTNTRCVCAGRMAQDRSNLMIECDNCKNLLHVACLGMIPQQTPRRYICPFCAGSTSAHR